MKTRAISSTMYHIEVCVYMQTKKPKKCCTALHVREIGRVSFAGRVIISFAMLQNIMTSWLHILYSGARISSRPQAAWAVEVVRKTCTAI
jgi:hypothetical protein